MQIALKDLMMPLVPTWYINRINAKRVMISRVKLLKLRSITLLKLEKFGLIKRPATFYSKMIALNLINQNKKLHQPVKPLKTNSRI